MYTKNLDNNTGVAENLGTSQIDGRLTKKCCYEQRDDLKVYVHDHQGGYNTEGGRTRGQSAVRGEQG